MGLNLSMYAAIEAEQALIGSWLIDSESYRATAAIVTGPEFLFSDDLRPVFKAVAELVSEGVSPDLVTVSERLKRMFALPPEENGWRVKLADLIHRVGSSAHATHYAKLVAESYYNREINRHATELVAREDQSRIEDMRQLYMKKEALSCPPAFAYDSSEIHDVLAHLGDTKSLRLVKTYFPPLDAAWMGMHLGDMNILALPPGNGKSIISLNLAHLGIINGQRVLFFTTEMTRHELLERHISIASGIPAWRMRTRKLELEHWKIVNDTAAKFNQLSFKVIDAPNPSIGDIERAIIEHKPEVVFLDYLERFKLPKESQYRLQVSAFANEVKTLCRSRGVIGYLTAQLNRDVYGPNPRRPTLADLSESKGIEQAADRVLLGWRPPEMQTVQGKAVIEFIQAKGRSFKAGGIFCATLDDNSLKLEEHL